MKISIISTIFYPITALCLGLTFYAIQHNNYPCKEAIELINSTDTNSISILWGTFGSNNKCLSSIIKNTKISSIVVHISNEVCRRNGNCYAGEVKRKFNVRRYNRALEHYNMGLYHRLMIRFYKIKLFTEQYPDIKWIISSGLEDNYTKKAFNNLLELMRNDFPDYEIIRNPNNTINRTRADGIELHNTWFKQPKKGSCFYSNDGHGICEVDGGRIRICIPISTLRRKVKELQKSNCETFAWTAKGQGINNKFVRPRWRDFRISAEDIGILKTINGD